MRRILGFMFYVIAVVLGLLVTLVLFFQVLTAIGLMSHSAKEPGLFIASFLFLFGAMLTNFLFRLGHNISHNKNGLTVGTKINLLIIAMVVDVVIFLKSTIPFLTQGHGVWSGSFALLSVIAFGALCWMFTKV